MSSTSSSSEDAEQATRRKLVKYTSLAAIVACPLIAALPPRKLDVYTLGLLGTTGISANILAAEYTGRSLVSRFQHRVNEVATTASAKDLPSDRAREVQKRLKEERLRQGSSLGVEEEKNLLKKVWMGKEGSDWREKRDEREKKALEEGRGYGGLIMDQIREVWNGGKAEAEELKEKDEKSIQKKSEAGTK